MLGGAEFMRELMRDLQNKKKQKKPAGENDEEPYWKHVST